MFLVQLNNVLYNINPDARLVCGLSLCMLWYHSNGCLIFLIKSTQKLLVCVLPAPLYSAEGTHIILVGRHWWPLRATPPPQHVDLTQLHKQNTHEQLLWPPRIKNLFAPGSNWRPCDLNLIIKGNIGDISILKCLWRFQQHSPDNYWVISL